MWMCSDQRMDSPLGRLAAAYLVPLAMTTGGRTRDSHNRQSASRLAERAGPSQGSREAASAHHSGVACMAGAVHRLGHYYYLELAVRVMHP